MIEKLKERFLVWLSWRLPMVVVYWCFVRVVANASIGQHSSQEVPTILCTEAAQRWRALMEEESPLPLAEVL